MTDVERQEEQFLAATDAKARQEAADAVAAAPLDTARGALSIGRRAATPAGPVDAGDAAADMSQAGEGRWGSGGVEIADVALLNDRGEPTHVFHTGEPMTLRMRVRAPRPVADFVFGVAIFNAEGVSIYGTNTDIEEHESSQLSGEAEVAFDIEALDLVEGTYKLDVAVHKRDGAPYDYHRLLYTFRVKSRLKDVGIYRPRHKWRFSGDVRFKPPR